MAVFNKTTAQTFAAMVAKFGQSVKVTRQGAAVCSGSGVFVGGTTSDVQASSLPGVASTANTSRSMLLQGTVTKPPLVGDDLTCSQGTYSITTVEAINPSGVVQLYKLEMN